MIFLIDSLDSDFAQILVEACELSNYLTGQAQTFCPADPPASPDRLAMAGRLGRTKGTVRLRRRKKSKVNRGVLKGSI